MNLNTITESKITYDNFLKDKQVNADNFLGKVAIGKVCLGLKGDSLIRIEKSNSLIGRIFEAICRFFTGVILDPKKVEAFTAKMLEAFNSDNRIELIAENSFKYKKDIDAIEQQLEFSQKKLENVLQQKEIVHKLLQMSQYELETTEKQLEAAHQRIEIFDQQLEFVIQDSLKLARDNLKLANVHEARNEMLIERIQEFNEKHFVKIDATLPEITEDDFESSLSTEESTESTSSEEGVGAVIVGENIQK